MLAIVTGTIQPGVEVGQLTIRNTTERLKQYIDSIQFLIDSKAFSKIIFCENSGYGVEELKELEVAARKENIQLELLSFVGNKEQLLIHGKGYGEGEIMKYVFCHSHVIGNEKAFVKITGRMKIVNIKKIVSNFKEGKTYFNIPNRTLRTLYDTRMYAMPVNQFQKYFMNRYEEVMDSQGYYLEHVYRNFKRRRNCSDEFSTLSQNCRNIRFYGKYVYIYGVEV